MKGSLLTAFPAQLLEIAWTGMAVAAVSIVEDSQFPGAVEEDSDAMLTFGNVVWLRATWKSRRG